MSTLLQNPVSRFGNTRVLYADEVDPGRQSLTAFRLDDTIVLPTPFDDLEMFSLMDGEQFLAAVRNDGLWGQGLDSASLYFGGTDEQPFLVEVDLGLIDVLRADGEQAFYEALKPGMIKMLEHEFGQEGSRRQGDVYAYKLPVTWQDLVYTAKQRKSSHPALRRRRPRFRSGLRSIEQTRHRLSGRMITCTRTPAIMEVDGKVLKLHGTLGAGTLIAPDHEPLLLNPGPYLLAVCNKVMERRPVQLPGMVGWLGE